MHHRRLPLFNKHKKKVFLRFCLSLSILLLIRVSWSQTAYTSFSCRAFSSSIPYFHTKINISDGVVLWSEACNRLREEQLLSSPEQFTQCDTDNKPFLDCKFKNVRIEDLDINRLQKNERGLSVLDKDGLSFHKLQLSGFAKGKTEKSEANPTLIRNIIDLERQQLPKERSKFQTEKWPILTKKFGLVLRTEPMDSCSSIYSEDVIIFYAYHTQNVWHLHEGLFRIWRTMHSNGLLHKSITVIQIDKEGGTWHHKEYLEVFKEVRWLKLKDVPVNSCFRKLHVVGYPQYMFDKVQADISDVQAYRSFMIEGLGIKESIDCYSKKIEVTFISRRNRRNANTGQAVPSGNRHLLNEDDLIKKIYSIENISASAYSFETLSKQEQVNVSCRSDILIGVHSGALLNALWLKSGSLLLQTQVPGVEYGSHEIWKRPPLLVIQGIGYYDMEQLAQNVGAYYQTLYASGYNGPSKDVDSCKFEQISNIRLLEKCYKIFKKERISYTAGTDFTVESDILLSRIYEWRRTRFFQKGSVGL